MRRAWAASLWLALAVGAFAESPEGLSESARPVFDGSGPVETAAVPATAKVPAPTRAARKPRFTFMAPPPPSRAAEIDAFGTRRMMALTALGYFAGGSLHAPLIALSASLGLSGFGLPLVAACLLGTAGAVGATLDAAREGLPRGECLLNGFRGALFGFFMGLPMLGASLGVRASVWLESRWPSRKKSP